MQKITLYVPAHDNGGRAFPEVLEHVALEFTKLGGGATVTSAVGYWLDGRFRAEAIRLVFTFVEDGTDLAPYRALAEHVKTTMAQISVLMTVEPAPYVEFI